MNKCENTGPFEALKQANIDHELDQDVVILARAVDTIAIAYLSLDTGLFLPGPIRGMRLSEIKA